MVKSGEFLGERLRPLLQTGLPLMEDVLKSLAKSVLISLGLTAVPAKNYIDWGWQILN